jgi:hypothetical protein
MAAWVVRWRSHEHTPLHRTATQGPATNKVIAENQKRLKLAENALRSVAVSPPELRS